MTIFDLLFVLSVLVGVGTAVWVGYLLIRRRTPHAVRILKRAGIYVVAYYVLLLGASAFQPRRSIPLGAQQCFDDWCIVVDGAQREKAIGTVHSAGDFIVVHARVVSRLASRPQREADVYAVLVDNQGGRHTVDQAGQTAMSATGSSPTLQDFVQPGGSNAVDLVFDVPSDLRSFEFMMAHDRFPHAVIIGDAESLLHRPVVVPLGGLVAGAGSVPAP